MSNVEKNWSHLFTLEALVKLSDIVMDNALKKNFTWFERLLPNCRLKINQDDFAFSFSFLKISTLRRPKIVSVT